MVRQFCTLRFLGVRLRSRAEKRETFTIIPPPPQLPPLRWAKTALNRQSDEVATGPHKRG